MSRYEIKRVVSAWCVYDKHRPTTFRPIATFHTLHEAEQFVIGLDE